MSIFIFSIGLFLAALFAHAGWSKIVPENQSYYQQVIRGYSLVPDSFPQPLMAMLPRFIAALELGAAFLILAPGFIRTGLLLAALLIGFYTLLFIKQLTDGKADIDCGCAGPGADSKINGPLVMRNIALLVLAAMAIFGLPGEVLAFHPLSFPIAFMIGLIYLSGDQLIANNQKIQLLNNT